MAQPDSFLRRVRQQLDDLSQTERRLADFLLDFPGELAGYSASELASLAGVSNATVSRFIRRLGYDSFDEARRQVRQDSEAGAPLLQSAGARSKPSSTIAAHLQHGQQNLAETLATIDDARLAAIVKAILAAPRVLIFGSRSSHGLAAYLRWQIIQVVPQVVVMPGAGETLAEHLATLSADDVVIAFGIRRQTRALQAVLEQASRAEAKLLSISDHRSAEFARATWSIVCRCSGPGLLDNHVAVMALCDLIANSVIEAAGVAGRRRLAAIDWMHDELGEI